MCRVTNVIVIVALYNILKQQSNTIYVKSYKKLKPICESGGIVKKEGEGK